jgi:hypothetical protein
MKLQTFLQAPSTLLFSSIYRQLVVQRHFQHLPQWNFIPDFLPYTICLNDPISGLLAFLIESDTTRRVDALSDKIKVTFG